MNVRRVIAVAVAVLFGGTLTFSQTKPATEGPASDGSPAWFLQDSFPDPTGRTIVDAHGNVTVPPRNDGPARGAARGAGPAAGGVPGVGGGTPPCRQSPVCGRRGGFPRGQLQ